LYPVAARFRHTSLRPSRLISVPSVRNRPWTPCGEGEKDSGTSGASAGAARCLRMRRYMAKRWTWNIAGTTDQQTRGLLLLSCLCDSFDRVRENEGRRRRGERRGLLPSVECCRR
jgi:hypothetical protein